LFENSESSQNTPPEQGSAAAVKFGQAHVWQWYGRYRKEGVGAYLPLVVQYHELSNAPGQGKNQGRKSDTFRTRKIFQVSILCEQEPLSENRFELSKNEKDEFGDPLPRLWYRSSEFDKRTYQHAAENLNTSLALSLSLHVAMDKNVYLGRHHLMGTTRMAEHDKDGVVDKNLKVFGSENIYALGGSVFPSGGAANPTLTIVALAMRLSGHLLHSRV
jgi:choline dehydrogenase-like flavoprotein